MDTKVYVFIGAEIDLNQKVMKVKKKKEKKEKKEKNGLLITMRLFCPRTVKIFCFVLHLPTIW